MTVERWIRIYRLKVLVEDAGNRTWVRSCRGFVVLDMCGGGLMVGFPAVRTKKRMVPAGWNTTAHKSDVCTKKRMILAGWNIAAHKSDTAGWVQSVVYTRESLPGMILGKWLTAVLSGVVGSWSDDSLAQQQPVSVGYSVGWPQFYLAFF